jgi:hypothetical protein
MAAPGIMAAPSRIPLAAGGVLGTTGAVCICSVAMHALAITVGLGESSNITQKGILIAQVNIVLGIISGTLLISAAVLSFRRRPWDICYCSTLTSMIISVCYGYPNFYSSPFQDSAIFINLVGLVTGPIGLTLLASCRRDFLPWRSGHGERFAGELLGFRRPVIPLSRPGDWSPQKFLDFESGREAGGALLLMTGSWMLIIACRALLFFSSFEPGTQKDAAMPGFFAVMLFMVLGGVSAIVSGTHSTVRMNWRVALPTGLLAVLGHLSPIFQEMLFHVRDYPGYMNFVDMYGTFPWIIALVMIIIAAAATGIAYKVDSPLEAVYGSG